MLIPAKPPGQNPKHSRQSQQQGKEQPTKKSLKKIVNEYKENDCKVQQKTKKPLKFSSAEEQQEFENDKVDFQQDLAKVTKSTTKMIVSGGKIVMQEISGYVQDGMHNSKEISGHKLNQLNNFRVDKQQSTMNVAINNMKRAQTFSAVHV